MRFRIVAERGAWLVVLLAVFVAGCVTTATGSREEIVQQRAQARWTALLAGDFNKAYDYMAPSYRTLVERKRYANQFGGSAGWLGAEVVAVTCTEERCQVRMKVDFRPLLGMRSGAPLSTHFDESWVREDGQWWMFQAI